MYISALMNGALTDGVLTCGLLADSVFMDARSRDHTCYNISLTRLTCK